MSAATRHPLAILGTILALATSLALAGVASAAPLGKDGKLHACYRVKGKPKGALRVVRGAKARCQRGERRVSWTLAGAVGAAGAPGVPGTGGAPGANGAAGSAGVAGADSVLSRTELEERITTLTDRVESLESLIGRVDGLEALVTGPVCDQMTALTEQTGALGQVIAGLSLNGILTGIGGLLNVPELPEALPEFSCG